MKFAQSYYTVQVAADLAVHQGSVSLKPEAPLLVLLGNVGDPLDVKFDVFMAWCSRQWQRVFLVPGDLEVGEPIATAGTCMRHNNVTLLLEGAPDTSLVGVTLVAKQSPPELVCATRGLPDVTLTASGIHHVPVTPPVCECAVEEGWARVPPVVTHVVDTSATPCRVCGYTTHTTAECPFSWSEKMRHNKRIWRADQSKWRRAPKPSLCASAPAITG